MKAPLPLRERKKEQTRRSLFEAALRLFEARGYEATTVDQIAAEAGVSRRTFFRYYPSKEAVVFPYDQERMERFRALIEASEQESSFRKIREAFLLLATEYMEAKDERMWVQRVVTSSASLMAYELQLDRRWEELVAGVLDDGTRSSFQAEVQAGAIIGAIRATLRAWVAGEGRGDLVALGTEGFEYLQRGHEG